MHDRQSENLTKPGRSINERTIARRKYSLDAILYTAPSYYDFLRYCDILAVCPQRLAHASALRAIFMTGVGDAIPEASYPFGTILRRIACVPYITLNRLHYLRGLQNTAEAPRVCDGLRSESFSAFASYTSFFSHFKENHIGASIHSCSNVHVTRYWHIYFRT